MTSAECARCRQLEAAFRSLVGERAYLYDRLVKLDPAYAATRAAADRMLETLGYPPVTNTGAEAPTASPAPDHQNRRRVTGDSPVGPLDGTHGATGGTDDGDPDGYLRARGAARLNRPAEQIIRDMRDGTTAEADQ